MVFIAATMQSDNLRLSSRRGRQRCHTEILVQYRDEPRRADRRPGKSCLRQKLSDADKYIVDLGGGRRSRASRLQF